MTTVSAPAGSGGLAGSHRSGESAARRRLADHREATRRSRHVRAAGGIAVHGGGVERRLRAQRHQRLGQNPVISLGKRDGFGGQRHGVAEKARQRVVDRHQRHQAPAL